MPTMDSDDAPSPALSIEQAKQQVCSYEALVRLSQPDPRLHDMLANAKMQLEQAEKDAEEASQIPSPTKMLQKFRSKEAKCKSLREQQQLVHEQAAGLRKELARMDTLVQLQDEDCEKATYELSQLTAEMVAAQASTTASQVGDTNRPTPAEAAIAGKVLRKFEEQATSTGGEPTLASLQATLAQWGAVPPATPPKSAAGRGEAPDPIGVSQDTQPKLAEKPPSSFQPSGTATVAPPPMATDNLTAEAEALINQLRNLGGGATAVQASPEQLQQLQTLANRACRSPTKADNPRSPTSPLEQPPTSKQRTERAEEPEPIPPDPAREIDASQGSQETALAANSVESE